MGNEPDDIEGITLTTGGLIKWIGSTAAIVVAAFSVIWFAANTSGDVRANTAAIIELKTDLKTGLEKADTTSQRRDEAQQRQIDNQQVKLDASDKVQVELLRKIDVLIEKLTALEKRENGGKQ